MDSISADEDVEDVESDQHVGLEASYPSIRALSQDIASWNIDIESSSRFVFNSDDPSTMVPTAVTSSIDEDEPHHHGPRLRPTFGNVHSNASVRSIVSHLFTGSRQIPAIYDIPDLCTYIERTPTAHINLSKWCKDRTGVRHEFLLLQIEGLENTTRWLRIERRAQRSAPMLRLILSTAPSDDSATLSANLERLFNESKSEVKVETKFTDPPSLKNLGSLLSILREESHTYTLWPQNCWFFCSIIYEHLFTLGRGTNTIGVPSEVAMSLAPKIRGKITRRVKDFLSNLPHFRVEMSRLLSSLPRANRAAYDAAREDAPSSCVQGTRVAVLSEIVSWLESVNGEVFPIYWLNGIAGLGKSTIAKTVAERAAEKGILGGSFFFSRSDGPLRDPSLVFPTLAFQLAQSDDAFRNVIGSALKHDATTGHKELLQQLEGLIVNPLLKIDRNRRTTLIILDALDECEESGAAEILRLLFSRASRIPFLRILITSRPERHISSAFDNVPSHAKTVLHDIDSSVVQEDIRHYIHDELTKIAEKLGLHMAADWVTEEEMDSLIDRSGTLFIYASTCIRFISDNRVRDPHRHLRIILDTETAQGTGAAQHRQLYNLYMGVLRNSLSDFDPRLMVERFQVLVGSMVVLRQHLPLNSFARFVQYETEIVRATLYRLGSVIVLPSNDHESPRFYHPSFVDFITDASRCTMADFVIAVPKQERHHALRCFELMATFLKRDMAGISDPSILNSEVDHFEDKVRDALPAEVQYACRYWAAHVSHVEHGDVAVVGALEKFSMESILWWFEAMSLIGSISTVAVSINEVRLWAMSSRCTATVVEILSDAHRFILAHAGIIGASALNVYHSALPFTPHDTALYKAYCHEGTRSITVLQGVESQWPLCLSTFLGHSGRVNCVVFSPDGLWLASCSSDRTVRLWDAMSSMHIATLEGHSDSVISVAFSPDGLRLASHSNDRTVRLWDTISGAHITTLEGHFIHINSIAFSPNGLRLASCSKDRTVRLWDTMSGAHIATPKGHSDWVVSVSFSPDGLRLASCSDDHTVRLWGAISGAHIATLKAHSDGVKSVTFSPNGLRLASCSRDYTVQLWDARSGVRIATLEGHSRGVMSVIFSPDGLRLASCSYDRTLRLWDVTSGAHIATLEGHSKAINSLAFSPNGLRLASCSDDRTVRLWDGMSGARIGTLKGHSGEVKSVAFSPDGLRLASCSDDDTVWLWDVMSGVDNVPLQAHFGRVNSVALSSNGLRLASCSTDSTVRLWDMISGSHIATLEGHSACVNFLTFSPDGFQLASCSDDRTVRLWDGMSGACIRILEGHSDWVKSVAFSPDGLRLASCSQDRTVRLWDTMSGARIATLKGHSDWVTSVSFSPDGLRLASCSEDRTVRLWNAISGARIATLKGHSGWVRFVAFSPDGLRLASCCYDYKVRVWDAVSGAHIGTLAGHSDWVKSVAFSPDGLRLASSSYDREVQLWDAVSCTYITTLSRTNSNLFADFSVHSQSPVVYSRNRHSPASIRSLDRWMQLPLAQDTQFGRICLVPSFYTPSARIEVSGQRIVVGCADGRVLLLSTEGLDF